MQKIQMNQQKTPGSKWHRNIAGHKVNYANVNCVPIYQQQKKVEFESKNTIPFTLLLPSNK